MKEVTPIPKQDKDARRYRLLECLKQKMSGSDIAESMGTTRSAVLGMIFRAKKLTAPEFAEFRAELTAALAVHPNYCPGAPSGRPPKLSPEERRLRLGENARRMNERRRIEAARRGGLAMVDGRTGPRPFGRSFTLPTQKTGLALLDWYPASSAPLPEQPESKRLSFSDLGERQCRWMDGGSEYCGHPVNGRSSYCAFHHGVVFSRTRAA